MCGREGEQTTHLKGGSVGGSSVLRAVYLIGIPRCVMWRQGGQTRNFLVRPLNLIFRRPCADDMPARPR